MKMRFLAISMFIIAISGFFNIIGVKKADACSNCFSHNPTCGAADGTVRDTAPSFLYDLCAEGNPSLVLGNGPWTWSCRACTHVVECSADKTPEDPEPVCGSSDGITTDTAPTTDLCDVGRATPVTGDGPWNWTCMTSPENSVDCGAYKIQDPEKPICGASDGGIFETMPVTDLCTIGEATTVTGTGPWNWTCVLDEQSVSCRASKTSDPVEPEDPEEEDEDDCDGAIGNTVWNDRNKNGMQDEDEEGIVGVKVRLYNGNHAKKDYTNSQGRYKFDDLCEGQYRVAVANDTLPAGCYQTYDKDGELDNMIKTRIANDEYYRKADFGYHCPVKEFGGGMSPNTGSGMIAFSVATIIALFGSGYWYTKKYI